MRLLCGPLEELIAGIAQSIGVLASPTIKTVAPLAELPAEVGKVRVAGYQAEDVAL